MPKFLIDREVTGAGALTSDELVEMAKTSCAALRELPEVQWVQSYVTSDRVTCVYIAPSAEAVREHARRAGIPCDRIDEVRAVIDPTTAEGALWLAGSANAAA